MKRLIVTIAFLIIVTPVTAQMVWGESEWTPENRPQEWLFGLQMADVDDQGRNVQADVSYSWPFMSIWRFGVQTSYLDNKPDVGNRLKGWATGGLFGVETAGDMVVFGDVTGNYFLQGFSSDYNYSASAGAGVKVYTGVTLIKIRLARNVFRGGNAPDQYSTTLGLAIGFAH